MAASDSKSKDGKPVRANIHDVARQAGVSIGTVSLALSDNAAVADSTKERVKQIASSLGYRPSAVGRALRSRRTHAAGLVVPHSSQHVFSHLYFMHVLSGVSEVLSAHNMTLVLSTAPDEADEDSAYTKILDSQQVDGIILASASVNDKNVARLQLSSHPFVFIGRFPNDPGVPSVGVDDRGGAYGAVSHLHGHRRIAHISGPMGHLSGIERHDGYESALREAGIEPQPQYCYEGDYSEETGRAGMERFLALAEPPTALFAANDEMALGAISALVSAGIATGIGFPVVGFDDVVLARVITPALTTVRQPMRRLGALAAELLMTLISGQTPSQLQTELSTELVVRSSCGCAAG